MKYAVDSGASEIVVRARSTMHDTTTSWTKLTGTVHAEPARLVETARASIDVDMRSFDAGDWLRNRKLKKDLAVDRYNRAVFELSELRDLTMETDEKFQATAHGSILWHDRTVSVSITGCGTITANSISATGKFELNVTNFGIKPPKFLMFKVEEEVLVEITLSAYADPG